MLNCFFLLGLDYPAYSFTDISVFEKDLINNNVTSASILKNFNFVSNSSGRIISGSNPKKSLAFVTPWNPVGYDLLLDFGNKFSYVVPTWFNYQCPESNYQGFDAVNQTWLKLMKEKHPNTKILVRLSFSPECQKYPLDKNFQEKTIDLIHTVSQYGLIDGFYFENQAIFNNPANAKRVHSYISSFKKEFPKGKCTIGIDIPIFYRVDYSNSNVKSSLKQLIKDFDFFFIAAYETPGTLSPRILFDLIISNMKSVDSKAISKMIIGLPLFGFLINPIKQSRDYIFGNSFIQTLQSYPVFASWNNHTKEHVFTYHDKKMRTSCRIEYPSIKFFDDRIQYAKTLPILGLGFWEIAQGLPYFFDVF